MPPDGRNRAPLREAGVLFVVPPRHLYVHVPFCARRCSYCDFAITVGREVPVDDYLDALRIELSHSPDLAGLPELDTLYFGGGTPSRLGAAGVERMLDIVRDHARLARGAEVTLEGNPEDITRESLSRWAGAGINRLSIGVQSFSDDALRWMHRAHSAADTRRALDLVRDHGPANFSLDLIFALPASLGRDWRRDLDEALAFSPPHVSLYGLTVEAGTPLHKWVGRGEAIEASEETYAAEFLVAHQVLTDSGFEHYEVSSFALPGMASRHNSAYWRGVTYAGVGPSAHRFDGGSRSWNRRSYRDWRSSLTDLAVAEEGREELGREETIAESVYLGLRTSAGVEIAESDREFFGSWFQNGWATSDGTRVRLTAEGWLRLDTLAADLTLLRSRW